MGVNDVRPKGRDIDTKEAIGNYKKELIRYRRGYQRARTADERPDTGVVDRRYADLLDMGVSEGEIREITDEIVGKIGLE